MKIVQAVKNKIIVRIIKKDEITKEDNIIIIPSTIENEPQGYGEVLSVGEEVTRVNVGDVILFHKHAGQDIILEKKILKVLMVDEIYGILKEN